MSREPGGEQTINYVPKAAQWRSADCRTKRHGSCIMRGSCQCDCHLSSLAKLRHLRLQLDADITKLLAARDQLDAKIAGADPTSARSRLLPEPHLRRSPHSEWRKSVVGAIPASETRTAAEMIDWIQAAWPSQWTRAAVATNIVNACTEGLIVRESRGVYRLP